MRVGTPVVAVLLTVTDTGEETALLLEVSRAMAVRRCLPSASVVVSTLVANGAVLSSPPTSLPSIWNRTPATATSSCADAETVTVPAIVAELAGDEMEMDGGVLSSGAGEVAALALD